MRAEDLRKHFMKIYPECSRREIEDLVSAIISSKYWKVCPDKNDAYYAVALTRARIPYMGGFRVRSTAPGIVIVSQRAARFCRRGRVLLIKKKDNVFISETIIEWLAFLKIIKINGNLVYERLVMDPNPPTFINRRTLAGILRAKKEERRDI
ncbi:MAG: hypothetical protein QW424_04000 [Candidatus Bathyarchaeia archaeon]